MAIDLEALTGDLTAIRNRLTTVTGYRRLTESQRDAVEDVRTRAQIALDRIAATQAPAEPEPPVEPTPVPSPDPDPEPTPESVDDYPPPPRLHTVVGAAPGTVVQDDTWYVDPQGSLDFPQGVRRVTVTDAKVMPWLCGPQDVYVAGTAEQPIRTGPRHDGGDGTQLKAAFKGPRAGQQPEDVTFRHWVCEDIDRRDGPDGHPDGIQIMAGTRVTLVDCHMRRVAVQPFFAKMAGASIGGGPIVDLTFVRCTSIAAGAEGYYSWRLSHSATDTREAPRNVRLIDCGGDRGVGVDQAIRANGYEAIGWRIL